MKRSTHTKNMAARHTRPLILTFLFFSGSAGLIYEILWMKMLTLIIGNTIFSITTVLTAFMGGLALGSFLAGRRVEKIRNPLKVYGILEGGIGAYALLLPVLIAGTEPLFRYIYQNAGVSFYVFSLLRFAICGALLLVPTTLMGATLPVLSKYFVERQTRLGRNVAMLYGVNTLGAVLGSFAAGFILIPILGISRTIYGAALLNLSISASVLLLSKRDVQIRPLGGKEKTKIGEQKGRSAGETIQEGRSAIASIVLIGIGMSGLAAMIYQIAWTRVLSLSLGPSVYAFSLIVTAFICGLALGSLVIAKFIDRRKDLVLGLALMEGAIGMSALLVVPVLGKLPVYIAEIVLESSHSFKNIYLMEFAIIFPLILIPTCLMGAAVPTAIKICTPDVRRVGRLFGNVYAVNTLGAIIGSFIAGFFLIPWLGMQMSIVTAVAINIIVAIIILLHAPTLSLFRRLAGALTTLVVVLVVWQLVPLWNVSILSSGLYLYADEYKSQAAQAKIGLEEAVKEGSELLFYKEGLHAVVAVAKNYVGELFLMIDGKIDATAKADAATQLLLGHLPLFLHLGAQDVLVIGLGSGMTLGAVERHPVKAVDVVDIESAVVEASDYFREFTGDALNDERVNVIIADGRNHLALTSQKYDVIISEPSNPWISGMANLFTREFFELAKGRLRKGGVMCQWVHAYSMFSEDFKTILRTFQSVFPHVTLWEAYFGDDYLIIGSGENFTIDTQMLSNRLGEETIRADLGKMHITDLPSMIGKILMTEESIAQYTEEAPLHTDDNALLEYSAPIALMEKRPGLVLEELYRYRTNPGRMLRSLGLAEISASVENDLLRMFQARAEVLDGRIMQKQGAVQDAIEKYESALSLRPRDYEATYLLAKLNCEMGDRLMKAQRPEEAVSACETSVGAIEDFIVGLGTDLSYYPDLEQVYAQAHVQLGIIALDANNLQEAAEAFRKSMSGELHLANAHKNLGIVYERLGQYEAAVSQYQQAVHLNPHFLSALMNLGNIYLQHEKYDEAMESYRQIQDLRPDLAITYYLMGIAHYQQEEWAKAERQWKRALELSPGLSEAQNALDLVRQKR